MNAMASMMIRDLKLYLKHRGACSRPWLFFILITILFPMVLRLSAQQIAEFAPAIIWLAAVIASIISIDSVLSTDFEDGSLDQLLLSPFPIALLFLPRLWVHWLIFALPILLTAPILALLLNMPSQGLKGLMITLLIGLPCLSLIAALGNALTLGLRQGGILLALLVLPWMMPVLLFGISGSLAASLGLSFLGEAAILLAILIVALLMVPIVIASVLRLAMQ